MNVKSRFSILIILLINAAESVPGGSWGGYWGIATTKPSLPGAARVEYCIPFALAASSLQSAPATGQAAAEKDNQYLAELVRNFQQNYRLGPGDEIAVRILGQPDYSLDKTRISPVGQIYHPLLGDVETAGLTVEQLKRKLTDDLSEYLVNPRVSVSLLTAQSARIGVLGDVMRPGIFVMAEPMTMLEAITAAGGFTELGSQSGVTLLRRRQDGTRYTMTVNVKGILKGKAEAEENLSLQAGDTVIVHGNTKKKLNSIASLTGFSSFLTFIAFGRR
jgi:polysaccharide biosynthesis/export protein